CISRCWTPALPHTSTPAFTSQVARWTTNDPPSDSSDGRSARTSGATSPGHDTATRTTPLAAWASVRTAMPRSRAAACAASSTRPTSPGSVAARRTAAAGSTSNWPRRVRSAVPSSTVTARHPCAAVPGPRAAPVGRRARLHLRAALLDLRRLPAEAHRHGGAVTRAVRETAGACDLDPERIECVAHGERDVGGLARAAARDHHRGLPFGARPDLERRLDDDARGAERTHVELRQVVARDVLDDAPPSAHERAIGADHRDAEEQVADRPLRRAQRTGQVGGHQAADRRAPRMRRIQRQPLAGGGELGPEARERAAGLDGHRHVPPPGGQRAGQAIETQEDVERTRRGADVEMRTEAGRNQAYSRTHDGLHLADACGTHDPAGHHAVDMVTIRTARRELRADDGRPVDHGAARRLRLGPARA